MRRSGIVKKRDCRIRLRDPVGESRGRLRAAFSFSWRGYVKAQERRSLALKSRHPRESRCISMARRCGSRVGITAVRDVLAARSRARSPRERNGRQTPLARGYLAHEELLVGQMAADYIRPVPTINLADDELAAVTSGNPAGHRRRPISPRPAARSAARCVGKAHRGRRASPAPESRAASQS